MEIQRVLNLSDRENGGGYTEQMYLYYTSYARIFCSESAEEGRNFTIVLIEI